MMSTTLTDQKNARWYQQGWPWFLIALPAIAVVACLVTLVIAIRSWDGLVVDDYYKEGNAIVKTIERTTHARDLGLSALVRVRSERLRVELKAGDRANLPARLVVTISHPTRTGLDQVVTLSGADGVYEGDMKTLAAGRWLFQLEDEARVWRMNGSAYLPTETEIRMDASTS